MQLSRVPARIVFEGSGAICIPLELEPPADGDGTGDFTLNRKQRRWIGRHLDAPWILRAQTEPFWQCWFCGWTPWPHLAGGKEVDPFANWFSKLHWIHRQSLVAYSRELRALERSVEVKRAFATADIVADRPGQGKFQEFKSGSNHQRFIRTW